MPKDRQHEPSQSSHLRPRRSEYDAAQAAEASSRLKNQKRKKQ